MGYIASIQTAPFFQQIIISLRGKQVKGCWPATTRRWPEATHGVAINRSTKRAVNTLDKSGRIENHDGGHPLLQKNIVQSEVNVHTSNRMRFLPHVIESVALNQGDVCKRRCKNTTVVFCQPKNLLPATIGYTLRFHGLA
jgi:hypothetical protein